MSKNTSKMRGRTSRPNGPSHGGGRGGRRMLGRLQIKKYISVGKFIFSYSTSSQVWIFDLGRIRQSSPTMRGGKRSKEEEEGPLLHAPLPPEGVLRCLRSSGLTVVPQKLRGRKWRRKRGCVADPSTPTTSTAEAEQKRSARTARCSRQIWRKRAGRKSMLEG